MAPQLCLFYVPGQPSKTVKRSGRKKTWSGGEEITTGKTGNTLCLRSGHRINWFLTLQTLPVFPVVIIRQLSRDKGQKAGPHIVENAFLRGLYLHRGYTGAVSPNRKPNQGYIKTRAVGFNFPSNRKVDVWGRAGYDVKEHWHTGLIFCANYRDIRGNTWRHQLG